MTKRVVIALMLAATLGGCGVFKGKGGPKTAVLGERIPVLANEGDATVEPSLATVPVTVPEPAPNDMWAQPGGNAAKSMGHPALGASLSRAWTASIPGTKPSARLAAGPIVAEGRLYVMDTRGMVHAFDARTGARVWQTLLGKLTGRDRKVAFGGGVSYDNGRIYGTNGRGDVGAFDPATGKQLWTVRLAVPLRGAPTVGGGNVYVLTQDNQIIALNPDDGSTRWTDSATLEAAGVFGVGAPAVAQGTVVAGFSSGELSALRYENGRVVWQDQLARTSISTSVSSISDIDASPVVDQGRVYAIGQGGRMVAMDLITGQRLWELSVGGISTPWLAGDWLFVVTDEAKVMCIARTTGKIRWITDLARWKDKKSRNKPIGWYGPVLAGGRLLVVNSDGRLVEIAVADGKVGRSFKAGKSFALEPIVANNTLYLLDSSGKIGAWR